MEFDTAVAQAKSLLKQAERHRQRAASASDKRLQAQLEARARALESEAAIEMAHAALLRHFAREAETAEAAPQPADQPRR